MALGRQPACPVGKCAQSDRGRLRNRGAGLLRGSGVGCFTFTAEGSRHPVPGGSPFPGRKTRSFLADPAGNQFSAPERNRIENRTERSEEHTSELQSRENL